MRKSRDVRIRLYDRAIEDYSKLKVRNDKQSKILLNSIDTVKKRLQLNPQFGDPISKDKIPKKYKHYGNVYRVELSNFWRLLYTIKGNEVEIIAFVLAIVDHREYNKIFGYK